MLCSTNDPSPRICQSIQSSLNLAGFKVTIVPVTQADFYGKYLTQPSTAKRGVWDIAPPGWIPDWFGNNGRSTLQPIFTSPGPGLQRLLRLQQPGHDRPDRQGADGALAGRGGEALEPGQHPDHEGRGDGADQHPEVARLLLGSRVEGCNFFFFTLSCDPTNVWLK